MELYIIRHGQSVNNAMPSNVDRVYDPELTDLGKAQADKLAAWLGSGDLRIPWTDPDTGYTRRDPLPAFTFDALYCSAMYRALQTAAPIGHALGIAPEVWIDIHEHGGIYLERADGITGYPGKTRAEILTEFPNYVLPTTITEQGWWNAALGHEERGAFYGRAIRVALELRRRAEDPDYAHQRIGIVTHGTFIDVLLKAFLNMLPSRTSFFLHYNTALTRLDFSERGVLVRCMNRVDHLPADMIS
ncbi:MAG: histidine phosphatase family protein [bacterium]|nr:histidine phosphatase family protein [bacterium]